MAGSSNCWRCCCFQIRMSKPSVCSGFSLSLRWVSVLRETEDGRVSSYWGVHTKHRQTVPEADLLCQSSPNSNKAALLMRIDEPGRFSFVASISGHSTISLGTPSLLPTLVCAHLEDATQPTPAWWNRSSKSATACSRLGKAGKSCLLAAAAARYAFSLKPPTLACAQKNYVHLASSLLSTFKLSFCSAKETYFCATKFRINFFFRLIKSRQRDNFSGHFNWLDQLLFRIENYWFIEWCPDIINSKFNVVRAWLIPNFIPTIQIPHRHKEYIRERTWPVRQSEHLCSGPRSIPR